LYTTVYTVSGFKGAGVAATETHTEPREKSKQDGYLPGVPTGNPASGENKGDLSAKGTGGLVALYHPCFDAFGAGARGS